MLECHPLEYRDPEVVASQLHELPGFCFLDSALAHTELGRYSFIVAEPFGILRVVDGLTYWNGTRQEGAATEVLKERLQAYRMPHRPDLPPFQGGGVGYLSYDFGRQLEELDVPMRNDRLCDDLCFGFYDLVIAFDHVEQKSWLLASGFPHETQHLRRKHALHRIARFRELLSQPTPSQPICQADTKMEWRSNFTREEFMGAVDRVKEFILDGDIFQANVAQRLTSLLPPDFDRWSFYERLRRTNPATFGAYLSFGDVVVASSSPERFLSLRDRKVETRPIKGTARRNSVPEIDRAAAASLVNSEKDRAENTMIVDLLRNDLSRACNSGTVEVTALCALESYASVHHLVSAVVGELRDGVTAVDLLAACFPGGSITGAPKIRAMDIITEIEGDARNLYCGAIGYLGFSGAMDTNIAIRTVVMSPEKAVLQAGGGITLLSNPAAEYDETMAKAQRVLEAF